MKRSDFLKTLFAAPVLIKIGAIKAEAAAVVVEPARTGGIFHMMNNMDQYHDLVEGVPYICKEGTVKLTMNADSLFDYNNFVNQALHEKR